MLKQKYSNRRLLLAMMASSCAASMANAANCVMPQPRPPAAYELVSHDGLTTTIVTPENTIFPKQDPFAKPPGSNLLPTVYKNVCDGNGVEIPNTLPSTPSNPYNLHPAPKVTIIDKTSPTDDLMAAIKQLSGTSTGADANQNRSRYSDSAVQTAIDILEGNPISGRVYSGLPLLHYNGPNKIKVVQPIFDNNNVLVGGVVNVHQVWFDSHIESDTAFIDPSAVKDVPWTIHYTIDTLNRGQDDFAPMVMYFDDPALSPPGMPPMPHVLMDQTFFPMSDGTRTEFDIAMAPGKYYNLSYHWGWRQHPPRVQVNENALKVIAGKTLPQWEISVFGQNPRANEEAKLAAIGKISDLAPEKRMWNILKHMKATRTVYDDDLKALNRAFDQAQNRLALPDGVKADPKSDWTLFYANNTIYGQMKGINDVSQVIYPGWTVRGKTINVKLLNGDYFDHAYFNVDFGGRRGWENTFQSTQAIGGSGQWFTFGRANWWVNAGMPTPNKPTLIVTPAATGSGANTVVGVHNISMQMNFEPGRRLRFYQFDPLHHETAVWSIH